MLPAQQLLNLFLLPSILLKPLPLLLHLVRIHGPRPHTHHGGSTSFHVQALKLSLCIMPEVKFLLVSAAADRCQASNLKQESLTLYCNSKSELSAATEGGMIWYVIYAVKAVRAGLLL